MKNSKMLIATGVVLISLFLNGTSPVMACNEKTWDDRLADMNRDWVQEDILIELRQLNMKQYSY